MIATTELCKAPHALSYSDTRFDSTCVVCEDCSEEMKQTFDVFDTDMNDSQHAEISEHDAQALREAVNDLVQQISPTPTDNGRYGRQKLFAPRGLVAPPNTLETYGVPSEKACQKRLEKRERGLMTSMEMTQATQDTPF